jgi:hypothetical protein
MKLLFNEKVAQYRGDTSRKKQIQQKNNRMITKMFDQNRVEVIGFLCVVGLWRGIRRDDGEYLLNEME